jgi:hypothetical protein
MIIENTQDLYVLEMNNGQRFQRELALFAMKNGFKTIVETGYGVSTIHFLYAMKHTLDMEEGKIYSIDPKPWYPNEVVSPQLEHIKDKSIPAMKDLYLRTGAWDLLLSDGNHDILCQTYEYEFGYACLKPGGMLAADDNTWGQHGAWQYFLHKYELTSHKLGDIDYVIKKETDEVLNKRFAEQFHLETLAMAEERESAWLEAGNKNSDVAWVRE